jgi:hypothetical protein
MTLARYFVFQQNDTWIVGFEGRVMAHFLTRTAALDSAKGMANLMGAMHYDADVMLDDGGPLKEIWVYGRDQLVSPAKRRRKRAKLKALPHDRSLIVVEPSATEQGAQA